MLHYVHQQFGQGCLVSLFKAGNIHLVSVCNVWGFKMATVKSNRQWYFMLIAMAPPDEAQTGAFLQKSSAAGKLCASQTDAEREPSALIRKPEGFWPRFSRWKVESTIETGVFMRQRSKTDYRIINRKVSTPEMMVRWFVSGLIVPKTNRPLQHCNQSCVCTLDWVVKEVCAIKPYACVVKV